MNRVMAPISRLPIHGHLPRIGNVLRPVVATA